MPAALNDNNRDNVQPQATVKGSSAGANVGEICFSLLLLFIVNDACYDDMSEEGG
jgi:hypothetical protein